MTFSAVEAETMEPAMRGIAMETAYKQKECKENVGVAQAVHNP